MNPADTQLIRDTILQSAKRFPRGMTQLTLETCVRSMTMINVSSEDMEGHIRYLMSAGFLEEVPKRTPEFRIWKITADGVDELASRGM